MFQLSKLTFRDKYVCVDNNKEKFNPNELKAISELSHFHQSVNLYQQPTSIDPLLFSQAVKLETFYKCCAPAYYSLTWEQEINWKVPYPISAIVAFKQPSEQYYSVDVKVATWAQSGGTRLTPLKASALKEKIAEIVKNTHAMIIPEFKSELQQSFFDHLSDCLRESKEYPVLALGNSAIHLLAALHKTLELKHKMDIKFHNVDMMAYVSHSDKWFADLDLRTRLQIENKPKIRASLVQLPLEVYRSWKLDDDIKVIGVSKIKNDDWSLLVCRENAIHYCFVDPRQNADRLQNISFGHTLIVNFMEEVRCRSKAVQQKYLQVGQYKITLKEQDYMYNVDVKLPKI